MVGHFRPGPLDLDESEDVHGGGGALGMIIPDAEALESDGFKSRLYRRLGRLLPHPDICGCMK